MSFSFFNSKSKKKDAKNQRVEEDTLKLTKEDVLKIREELKRYEEQQVMMRNNEKNEKETRQGKKYKERNRFLNVAIILVILLLGLVFYAVFHW